MKESITIKKVHIFETLFCFLASGFLGWVFETIAVLTTDGKLTDRGILFFSKINGFSIMWGLPFILIYAIGGVILICTLKPLKNRPVLLFSTGVFSMTTLELLVSYYDQYVMHQTLWDYSKDILNFQGRICLRSSVAWGVLSIFVIYILSPLFQKAYNKLDKKRIFHLIIVALVMYVIVCYLIRPLIFPGMV